MSFLKPIAKSVRSLPFLAMSSALVMVAGMLFGANIATADSVWVQSYERKNQTQACSAQPGETPWQESWGADSSWSPSREQWANNGKGGWTCTRSIMWARDSAARIYNVGDIGPGGGTVFYVDMARAAGSQFWEVGSDLGTAEWGCRGTEIAGTLMGIGTGEANTTLIKNGCPTVGIAARVASDPAGGYSNWFLPSMGELNQLCKFARNQSTAVVDQEVPCDNTGTLSVEFASGNYLSSSEANILVAWYQYFDSGVQGNANKDNLLRVRPVRVF
jgi:hypothetical protein